VPSAVAASAPMQADSLTPVAAWPSGVVSRIVIISNVVCSETYGWSEEVGSE
jgi:hypothetical protein